MINMKWISDINKMLYGSLFLVLILNISLVSSTCDNQCLTCASNICSVCVTGYNLTTDGYCCTNNCSNCTTGQCNACNDGNYLSSGVCTACST